MGDTSVMASFTYWATTRSPDPSEAYSIANGECKDMKMHLSPVSDIRPSQSSFDLDQHGFMIVKHGSRFISFDPDIKPERCLDFSDNAAVTAHFWPETCALIQSKTNARSVVALHSIARTSASGHRHEDAPPESKINKPFFVVHVDYSPAGCRTVLRSMLPSFFEDVGCIDSTSPESRDAWWAARNEVLVAEVEDIRNSPNASSHLDWDGANYSGPRWAMYSIWRPLETVLSDPLAVLDPRAIFSDEPTCGRERYKLIKLPQNKRPGFIPEFVATNIMPFPPPSEDEYKWSYISEQRPDEVYILKLFDSEAWKEGEKGKIMPCVPHSAFELPGQEGNPPRNSVEMRVLVVW